MESREDRIRRRAAELYVLRGGPFSLAGSALEDWLQAEKEVRETEDRVVDEASKESFPASDAPSY
jgi:hypothetical protein